MSYVDRYAEHPIEYAETVADRTASEWVPGGLKGMALRMAEAEARAILTETEPAAVAAGRAGDVGVYLGDCLDALTDALRTFIAIDWDANIAEDARVEALLDIEADGKVGRK